MNMRVNDTRLVQWHPLVYDFLSDAAPGNPELNTRIWQQSLYTYPCLGLLHNETPVMGALIHMRQPWRGEMSVKVVSPRYVTPDRLAILFDWIFNKLNVKRLESTVCVHNQRSIVTTEKLGLKREGRAALAWDGIADAYTYGMTRHDCRFLDRKIK